MSEHSGAGDELVDIVDEMGNVVAVVPRIEMRGRRLPHRCVYILVFNSKGQIFVHQRTATKDVFPSYWDVTVGGVLAAGESYDDGARRELKEELGIETDIEPLFLFPYSDDATIVYGKIYKARHEGPFRLQPEEIVFGEFVPIEEILKRARKGPFCPDGLAVFDAYLKTCSS